MKTIDFSYFIERYIANEMNEDEKSWFEKEIEGNSALRDEVELRRKTETALKNQDVIKLRAKLAAIEKSRERTIPVKSPGKRVTMGIAATITIMVVVGSAILSQPRHLSNDQIFKQYYKSYDELSSSRSSEAGVNKDYDKGMKYYTVHDYSNAALYFSKVLTNDPGNMTSEMYYGTSNFEINNYPEAKSSFSKVIDNNNNLFIEDARWYLALCYIRTNEIKKAVSQLSDIKNSRSIYSKDAGKILKWLK